MFDYVTNGADSTYDVKEIENRGEVQLMAFMKLWAQFGRLRAYFLWGSLKYGHCVATSVFPWILHCIMVQWRLCNSSALLS